MKAKYLFILFFLSAATSFGQNNSVVLDGGYIILSGGTAANNIYVVVDQSSTSGIVRPGGGHISSEGQYNYVKWVSGTSTGNYIFPFGVGGTAADYIPFTFNKTTGAGSSISMSTWTSNSPNVPWAAISNVPAVANMNITGTVDLSVPSVIDRWWDIQSSAAVAADLTFSYRGIENTTAAPLDTFKAQHWNGASWDIPAGPGNPGITAGIGSVGPIPGQTTFSPWILTRSGLSAIISSSQNPLCNNQCTGTAAATPSGGTSPYTYSWTGSGQTTSSVTGLCAGNYTVTVTDAAGVTTTTTVAITQPTVLTASVTPTDVLCNSQCNGAAVITSSGGTPGYTYLWNTVPAQSIANASGLCATSYTCTVTDLNGCTITQTVSINQPTALTATATSTPATCGNANGTATAAVAGGSGSYTYLWNPSAAATATATGLTAGNYTATITDANGCSTTQTVSITNSNGPTATMSQINNLCNGQCLGTAAAAVAGGSQPYTYSWTNGQSTSAANNLCAGNYTVTVTDNNGCTTTQVSIIVDPSILSVTATTTPTSCTIFTGTASANVSGGTTGYTYLWNPSSQTSQTASGLAAGTYSAVVTDANGCSQTQTVTVSTVPGPTITVSAAATTIPLGSSTQITATGGGTYQWSPVTGLSCTTCANPVAAPSITTTYCAVVTDVNGCKDSSCVTINVDIPCGTFYIPNAFSPNNDGENDFECVFGNCIETLHITIYDRWGEKVFESDDQTFCWDGMYNGKPENTAVFTYYLNATFKNGDIINKKGNISLIR